eukprot:UN33229
MDWFLDIIMSIVQLDFAAPKMNNSLFFILEMFVLFITWFSPMPFVLWIWLQLVPNEPRSLFYFKATVGLIMFIYIIWHIYMRRKMNREGARINECAKSFMFRNIHSDRVLFNQDYDKVFVIYAKQNKSVVHAWTLCINSFFSHDKLQGNDSTLDNSWKNTSLPYKLLFFMVSVIYTYLSENDNNFRCSISISI